VTWIGIFDYGAGNLHSLLKAIQGEMRQQGDAVRTGNDLERRDQHAPPGIPFDIHLR